MEFPIVEPYKLPLSPSLTFIPPEVYTNTSLVGLEILHHPIEEISQSISLLQNLKRVTINFASFRDLPDELFQIPQLSYLNLGNNSLRRIPQSISNLTSLKTLILIDNKVLDIRTIKYATTLEELNIAKCGLPNLPQWIGELKNLKILRIYENELTELPSSMIHLQNLKTLDASDNQLSYVPTWIIDLQNLSMLDLSRNPIVWPDNSAYKSDITTMRVALNNQLRMTEERREIKLVLVGDEKGAELTKRLLRKSKSLLSVFDLTEELDKESEELKVINFGGRDEIDFFMQLSFGTSRTIFGIVIDVTKDLKLTQKYIKMWRTTISAYSTPASKQIPILLIGVGGAVSPHVKDTFSSFVLARQLSLWCTVSATSSEELFQGIAILSEKIKKSFPTMYKQINDVIKKYQGDKMILPVSVPHTMDQKHANDSCFFFLQDVEEILYEPISKQICRNPKIFTEALSHIFSQVDQSGIKSKANLIKEIQQLNHSREVAEEIVDALQQWLFCFALDAEEASQVYKVDKGLLFPALRPPVNEYNLKNPRKNSRILTISLLTEFSADCSLFFFKLQAFSRRIHQKTYPLYSNRLLLQDKYNNHAVIWKNSSESFQIIIQGMNPKYLLDEIKQNMEQIRIAFPGMIYAYVFLCPICIQNTIESKANILSFSSFPNMILENSRVRPDEIRSSGEMHLGCGHKVRSISLLQGYSPFAAETSIKNFDEIKKGCLEIIDHIQESGKIYLNEIDRSIFLVNPLLNLISEFWFHFIPKFPSLASILPELEFQCFNQPLEAGHCILDLLHQQGEKVTIDSLVITVRELIALIPDNFRELDEESCLKSARDYLENKEFEKCKTIFLELSVQQNRESFFYLGKLYSKQMLPGGALIAAKWFLHAAKQGQEKSLKALESIANNSVQKYFGSKNYKERLTISNYQDAIDLFKYAKNLSSKMKKIVSLLEKVEKGKIICSNLDLSEFPKISFQPSIVEDLILKNNFITSIPSSIKSYSNIVSLNLSNNQIQRISSEIWELSNLRSLNLENNLLEDLNMGDSLNCYQLEQLNLAHNKLSNLPNKISELLLLQNLNIKENTKIRRLPLDFYLLSNLEELEVTTTGFLFPPEDILVQGPKAVSSYMSDMLTGAEESKRIKLVFLGDSLAGKTSVINSMDALIKKEEPKLSYPTFGIDIRNEMKSELVPKVEVSIWDFSGREEYRVVQNYFMSSGNTIYCIVVDLQEEVVKIMKSIDYWCDLIKDHSHEENFSKTFSIMLIGNKRDMITISKNLEVDKIVKREYMAEGKISSYVSISAKQMSSIESLRHFIIKETEIVLSTENPHFRIPKIFSVVEKNVEDLRSKNRIIVHSSELIFQSNICLQYLEDLGVLISNNSSGMLCLDPLLLVKAMSCFLMPTDNNKISFVFTKHQILQKLDEMKEFIARSSLQSDISILLDLLIHFEFCMKISNSQKEAYGIDNPNVETFLFPSLSLMDQTFEIKQEKLIGLAISDKNKKKIGQNFFNRFQILSSSFHDLDTQVFANGFYVKHDSNVGLVWIDPQFFNIQIIIKGYYPTTLQNNLKDLIVKTALNFKFLELTFNNMCPKCVFQTIDKQKLTHLPSILLEFPSKVETNSLICSRCNLNGTAIFSSGVSTNSMQSMSVDQEEIQEIISFLEDKNSQHVDETVLEYVLQKNFHIKIQNYWNFFGTSFPEIKNNFKYLKYISLPQSEKIILILKDLKRANVELKAFIQVIKSINFFSQLNTLHDLDSKSIDKVSIVDINQQKLGSILNINILTPLNLLRSILEKTLHIKERFSFVRKEEILKEEDEEFITVNEIMVSNIIMIEKHYLKKEIDLIPGPIPEPNVSPKDWKTDDVCRWLYEENLSEFESIIRDQEIDGEFLFEAKLEEWFEVVKIAKRRVRFLRAVKTLSKKYPNIQINPESAIA